MIYKLEFRMPTGGQYSLDKQTISLDLTTIKSIPANRLVEPMTLKFEGAMGYTWIKTSLYYKERPSQEEIEIRKVQFNQMIRAYLEDLFLVSTKTLFFDHTEKCADRTEERVQ